MYRKIIKKNDFVASLGLIGSSIYPQKKNDYVASRWKINRKKGKGKSVIQVELLTVHLTNLTHIPFAQLLFVFCIILVF